MWNAWRNCYKKRSAKAKNETARRVFRRAVHGFVRDLSGTCLKLCPACSPRRSARPRKPWPTPLTGILLLQGQGAENFAAAINTHDHEAGVADGVDAEVRLRRIGIGSG